MPGAVPPTVPVLEIPALPEPPVVRLPGGLAIREESVTGAPQRLNTFDQNVPGFSVTFLLLGLRTGEASVVIPIANMSFVVALLTSAAFGMERITRLKLLAVGCAAVAIALLTGA